MHLCITWIIQVLSLISSFVSKHAGKPFPDGEQARVLMEIGYDYIFDNPFTIPDDK